MKSHSGRGLGAAQRGSHLTMAHLLHAAQQQHLALRGWQGGKRTFELLVVLVLNQAIERVRIIRIAASRVSVRSCARESQ